MINMIKTEREMSDWVPYTILVKRFPDISLKLYNLKFYCLLIKHYLYVLKCTLTILDVKYNVWDLKPETLSTFLTYGHYLPSTSCFHKNVVYTNSVYTHFTERTLQIQVVWIVSAKKGYSLRFRATFTTQLSHCTYRKQLSVLSSTCMIFSHI